jgi:hypothetical protein
LLSQRTCNHFSCQVIPVRQGGPGIPKDLLLLQDTPTAVGATSCPVRAGRTSMQRTDVRIAARGRRSAARCCWPVSSARPSGSGSTCRGDI